MAISNRYSPEKPPAENCNYGLDYSKIIPPGVGIASGSVSIWWNLATPVLADADWQIGPVTVRGRTIYARLSGGIEGRDYQIRWVAVDTDGNTWPRTALQLVAQTS